MTPRASVEFARLLAIQLKLGPQISRMASIPACGSKSAPTRPKRRGVQRLEWQCSRQAPAHQQVDGDSREDEHFCCKFAQIAHALQRTGALDTNPPRIRQMLLGFQILRLKSKDLLWMVFSDRLGVS